MSRQELCLRLLLVSWILQLFISTEQRGEISRFFLITLLLINTGRDLGVTNTALITNESILFVILKCLYIKLSSEEFLNELLNNKLSWIIETVLRPAVIKSTVDRVIFPTSETCFSLLRVQSFFPRCQKQHFKRLIMIIYSCLVSTRPLLLLHSVLCTQRMCLILMDD